MCRSTSQSPTEGVSLPGHSRHQSRLYPDLDFRASDGSRPIETASQIDKPSLCSDHVRPPGSSQRHASQFLDSGRTERRHIIATEFVLIGKEANMVGESGEADPIVTAVEEFKD